MLVHTYVSPSVFLFCWKNVSYDVIWKNSEKDKCRRNNKNQEIWYL